MFDFLIVMLGGFTKTDRDNWDKIQESWRARCLAAETTVELVKEIMQRERERSDKLMERLNQPHIPLPQQSPPTMNPVGQSRSSWPRIKRDLERQHRVNAEVPGRETEKEIREKVGDSVRGNE